MACESWQAKLDTYLDGELPSDRCALSTIMCAVFWRARRRFGAGAEEAERSRCGKRFTPSPEFRSRIQKSICRAAATERWVCMEDGECCLCACFGGRDRVFRYLAIPYRPGFWRGCGLARGALASSSPVALSPPIAYGEALVPGKDTFFVRFAGIAEFRILSARRPHDLPGTSAGRSLDLSSAEA